MEQPDTGSAGPIPGARMFRALGRTGRFVALSVALHGMAAFGLTRLRSAPPTRGPIALEVDVRHEKPRPPAPAPKVLPPPIAAIERRPERTIERRPDRAEERDRDERDRAIEANPSLPPTGPATPERNPDERQRPIDLFARNALERAVPLTAPTGPSWGGTTRRLGDGKPIPGERDAASDRAEAAARIGQFVAEATGAERVRSGRVAPRWRDAERQLTEGFHPPPALVKEADIGRTYVNQMLNTIKRGPPPSAPYERGANPSAEVASGLPDNNPLVRSMALDQQMAAQQATGMAASWTTAEVEAVIGSDGKLESIKITRISGRRKFDQAALEAVRKAVEGRGPLEEGEKRGVVTRWSVSASLTVAPPTSLGFGFDEVTGKVHGAYPFKQEVKTKVALLSVTPR